MRLFYRFIALLACFLPAVTALAGGAQQTSIDGIPYQWNESVSFNLDGGDLKAGEYNHAAARQLVLDAFATWSGALTSGSLSAVEGEVLPLAGDGSGDDVTASNYTKYLNSSAEVNPIVFDEDGEIIDAIYGECAKFSLLAFAGFERLGGGEIKKARAVFSGACIPDASGNTLTQGGCGSCTVSLDDPLVRQMILHETGHLLGMDHSQVNPNSYQECRNAGECPSDVAEDLPTMFPIAVPGASMDTLHADDVAYFNRLYGDPQTDTCSVSGRVLGSDGATELRGVEVVARNADASLETVDAISFVSGAEAPRFEVKNKSASNCVEGCGDYLITGLKEGETYTLCVQNILSQFTGASGIEPVDPPVPQVQPECFGNIQLTCDCSGSGCQAFTGQDLTTQAGGGDALGNLTEDNFASAGGCSLVRPHTRAWRVLSLVFSRGIQ
jgi:hypothetical protein